MADGRLKAVHAEQLLALAAKGEVDLGIVLLTYRAWAQDADLLRMVKELEDASQVVFVVFNCPDF